MKSKIIHLATNGDFIYSTATQVLSLLNLMIVIKLLALGLSEELLGDYYLIMSITYLISMLPFSALNNGVSRYISKMEYKKLITAMFLLYILILLGYVFILLSSSYLWHFSLDIKIFYFYVVVNTLKNLVLNIEMFSLKRKIVFYFTIIDLTIKTIFLSYFLNLMTLNMLFSIFTLSEGIILAIFIIKFLYAYGVDYTNSLKEIISPIIHYSKPFMIWNGIAWFMFMANRWFLEFFCTGKDVAGYSLIVSISQVIPALLMGIINSYMVPHFFIREDQDQGIVGRDIKKIYKILIILFIILAIIVNIFSEDIVIFASDTKYAEYSKYMFFQFLSVSVFNIAVFMSNKFMSEMQTARLYSITLYSSLYSLIIGFFAVKYFGIQGAVFANLTTNILYFYLTLIKFNK